MIRVAVIGVGKMGLSHLSIVRALPDVEVCAVVDSSGYILDVLTKYTGLATYKDVAVMYREARPDAVILATPTKSHAALVRDALDRGVHVFCEKPLTLDPHDSEALARLAEQKGLVTQVGYHNRFVGAFHEVATLMEQRVLGEVHHVLAEAYGPVVLRPKGGTWRSRRAEGGGCLYDYAAHPLDLLMWYFGEPEAVGGTRLASVFSSETEDEVYSTLFYPDGKSAQLSVNWSDESHRKMSTTLTIWGRDGRINVDRQECQVYLRDTAKLPEGYQHGWNVRYTTEMTSPVSFYLRGEEYSAQLEHFVGAVGARQASSPAGTTIDFRSAAMTDRVIAALLTDAGSENRTSISAGSNRSTSAPPIRPTTLARLRRKVFRGRRIGR